ncbi:putative germin-like protein 8-1 [Salvia hispanica]|uniref:putative germin-like protein 8-1 n=1 Tax=Salvia hispanica TaxID=49212 RepID=UPI0020097324|nr:putative germin-like protein 8-1 [Salvia hispanica]
MASSAILFITLAFLNSILISLAFDPSPLQDICVAPPLGLATSICRDPRLVTANDFFMTGLDRPGPFNAYGVTFVVASVLTIPELNTQGQFLIRAELAPNGYFPPHTHPRASVFSVVMTSSASVSTNVQNIPMLNGSNFKDWKETLLITLGCMDLDLALRTEKPAPLTDVSTADLKRDFERWERSNRVSLMIIKRSIPEAFRGTASEDIANASEYLAKIEERFAKNEKSETSTLLANLISMKYKGKGNIREYIMQMSHIASNLKAHKLEVPEDLLVHLVLLSLPTQFSQFKVSYNCQKEKWSLNELIS